MPFPKKGEPHPYAGIPRAEWPTGGLKEKVPVANAPATPDAQAARPSPAPVASAPHPSAAPRNLFSGDIKKLEVFGKNGSNTDPIPGYRLYWFLDREGSGTRLHQAKMSGWEFVLQDEVAVNDQSAMSGNVDLGSQVKVFGGSFNNAPIYHYLMKKPLWLDQQHFAESQAYLDKIEGELKRGTRNRRPEDHQYTGAEMPGSALPPISITHGA